MIHYHGTPITPVEAAIRVLKGRHAFISYASPRDLGVAAEFCESFALDNGAFSVWRRGHTPDWPGYYEWVADAARLPNFDWAVIPDVIGGSELDNDRLISEWPLPQRVGVPVWHLHESLERLFRLANEWPRVALGSSGEYGKPNTKPWWARIQQTMLVLRDKDGYLITKLHGLRMLNPAIFRRLPLSSGDSTNVAQNNGTSWNGQYEPATPGTKAVVIAERIELSEHATKWEHEL